MLNEYRQMARLVRVCKGQWLKTEQGAWIFDPDENILAHDILIGYNDDHDKLQNLVRTTFSLRQETPMILTFQLPQWMLEPDGETLPPQNLQTIADVETMMSVHEWDVEPMVCAIFGAEDVATYQFRCRTPFKIGSRSFLEEGVTEEQHTSMILGKFRYTCATFKKFVVLD